MSVDVFRAVADAVETYGRYKQLREAREERERLRKEAKEERERQKEEARQAARAYGDFYTEFAAGKTYPLPEIDPYDKGGPSELFGLDPASPGFAGGATGMPERTMPLDVASMIGPHGGPATPEDITAPPVTGDFKNIAEVAALPSYQNLLERAPQNIPEALKYAFGDIERREAEREQEKREAAEWDIIKGNEDLSWMQPLQDIGRQPSEDMLVSALRPPSAYEQIQGSTKWGDFPDLNVEELEKLGVDFTDKDLQDIAIFKQMGDSGDLEGMLNHILGSPFLLYQMGVTEEDVRACYNGDKEACQRIFSGWEALNTPPPLAPEPGSVDDMRYGLPLPDGSTMYLKGSLGLGKELWDRAEGPEPEAAEPPETRVKQMETLLKENYNIPLSLNQVYTKAMDYHENPIIEEPRYNEWNEVVSRDKKENPNKYYWDLWQDLLDDTEPQSLPPPLGAEPQSALPALPQALPSAAGTLPQLPGGAGTLPPLTTAPQSPESMLSKSEALHNQAAGAYEFGHYILEEKETDYEWGAETLGESVDCSGLVYAVIDKLYGVKLDRTAKTMANTKYGDEVSPDDLRYGDLVFYHTTRSGISHMGIYVGDGGEDDRMVYASSVADKVIVMSMKEYTSKTGYPLLKAVRLDFNKLGQEGRKTGAPGISAGDVETKTSYRSGTMTPDEFFAARSSEDYIPEAEKKFGIDVTRASGLAPPTDFVHGPIGGPMPGARTQPLLPPAEADLPTWAVAHPTSMDEALLTEPEISTEMGISKYKTLQPEVLGALQAGYGFDDIVNALLGDYGSEGEVERMDMTKEEAEALVSHVQGLLNQ